MNILFKVYQFEKSINKNSNNFKTAKNSLLNRLKEIYKNYNIEVDKSVFKAIIPFYTKNIDSSIYNNTSFISFNKIKKNLEDTANEVLKKINKDKAYIYAKPFIKEFYTKLNPEFNRLNNKI